MQQISLPIWLLMASVGLPTLFGLLLSCNLIRKKRKRAAGRAARADMTAFAVPETSFNGHIRNQLLAQQIDTVFNGLVALIEAERAKLKTLAAHHVSQQPIVQPSVLHCGALQTGSMQISEPEADLPQDTVSQKGAGINSSISDFVAQGAAPEEIARSLGISQSEALLAIACAQTRHKLEAVV